VNYLFIIYLFNSLVCEFYRFIDIGGNKPERKKWGMITEKLTAIIYCVDLNSYDQKGVDGEINRMVEQMSVFEDIIEDESFDKIALVIFLNKIDLFEDKIRVGFNQCFPNFSGNGKEDAIKYIKNKMLDIGRTYNPKKKNIYFHETVATNSENIIVIFDAMRKEILTNNLNDLGFEMG